MPPKKSSRAPSSSRRKPSSKSKNRKLAAHRIKSAQDVHSETLYETIQTIWPTGLKNHQPRSIPNDTGVSCHRNAVLQSLLHIPDFVSFLNLGHDRCNKDKTCVFCMLIQLSYRYWGLPVVARGDTGFQHAFSNFVNAFNDWYISSSSSADDEEKRREDLTSQQDPSETQNHLLNAIDLISPATKPFLDELFDLRMIVRRQCKVCNDAKSTEEDMQRQWHIRIARDDNRSTTLEECIKQKMLFNPVEGVRCSNEECKSDDFKETARISQAPRILTFVIARNLKAQGKQRNVVLFPDKIDLTDYAVDQRDLLQYELHAVVSHQGENVNAGHYFAVIREKTERVVACNDRQIIRFARHRERLALHIPSVTQTRSSFTTKGDASLLYYVKIPPKGGE